MNNSRLESELIEYDIGGVDWLLLYTYIYAMSEAAKRNGDDRNSLPAASSSAAGKKVIIKSADMKDDLQTVAINIAIDAFEKHSVEKDVAEYIKKEFDKKHGPTWHCIVGKNFGSFVTHETNHFIYFYLDTKAVLLFKSG